MYPLLEPAIELRWGFEPAKIYRIARLSFKGQYDDAVILKWMKMFYRPKKQPSQTT